MEKLFKIVNIFRRNLSILQAVFNEIIKIKYCNLCLKNCSMLELKSSNAKTDLIYSILENGTKCS